VAMVGSFPSAGHDARPRYAGRGLTPRRTTMVSLSTTKTYRRLGGFSETGRRLCDLHHMATSPWPGSGREASSFVKHVTCGRPAVSRAGGPRRRRRRPLARLQPVQPQPQVVPGGQDDPQRVRGAHHQQLQLAARLVPPSSCRSSITSQVRPRQRRQVLQQPLGDGPPVQVRRR
jgi:hypothetical protein